MRVLEWRAVAERTSGGAVERFQRRLLDWFARNKRELPWRRTRNGYRVWLAETMLQQTRTAAALPYYRRFLERFPSLAALARARPEAVLRAWSGLGYYRRAGNLHQAARVIMRRHGGRFPRRLADALALPGIGAYTARAVLSIGYGEPFAALDGNVARVIARREAIEGDLRAPANWKRLARTADTWLARESAGDWNQAMMELGATVCTPRRPHCGACPVRAGCRAYRLGIADRLPARRPARATRLRLAVAVPVDERGRTLLVREEKSSAIFSRLWHFPAVEARAGARARLERYLAEALGMSAEAWEPLGEIRHTVTFREITFEGWVARVRALAAAGGANSGARCNAPLRRVAAMAVSSATRKLAEAAAGRDRLSLALRQEAG